MAQEACDAKPYLTSRTPFEMTGAEVACGSELLKREESCWWAARSEGRLVGQMQGLG